MTRDRIFVKEGGVTGLCAAYHLARRACPVTVLDRAPPWEGASGGSAGILAVGHMPLALPGLAAKALRWMFDRESPLFIPPRLEVGLLRWFLAFNNACNQATLTPPGSLAHETR